MSSLQFVGVDKALQAYDNRNCAAWGLFQGRQFLFKYEGKDLTTGKTELENILNMLCESSNAIYTLKVYEDLGPKGKIKENTPCDGSFNFKLNQDSQLITTGQYTRLNTNNEILQELKIMNARITAIEEDPDEEDPEEDTLGKITGIVRDPAVQQLIGWLFNKQPMQAAAISGVPDPNQDQKITAALEILKEKDSKLGEHLQKLATMANEKPQNFNYLISILDQT